jgi:hypothetical protein
VNALPTWDRLDALAEGDPLVLRDLAWRLRNEVEEQRQAVAQMTKHAIDEHSQGWSEAIGYLQGLAAGSSDDAETMALWRAAEKLAVFAKELRQAAVES